MFSISFFRFCSFSQDCLFKFEAYFIVSPLICSNRTSKKVLSEIVKLIVEFFLFGVLRRFQHCTGHITTGSWKGRGNQYIEFARVVYCKLPTNGKQLPAFPLKAVTGIKPPTSEVRGESVTTLPPLIVESSSLLTNIVWYTGKA